MNEPRSFFWMRAILLQGMVLKEMGDSRAMPFLSRITFVMFRMAKSPRLMSMMGMTLRPPMMPGWVLALFPRGLRPFERLALAPAVGIAVLILGGIAADGVGLRLVGAGGAGIPIAVALLGAGAARLRLRRADPNPSSPAPA